MLDSANIRRIRLGVTDSTNTQARRLAVEHPGEVLLVTAARQTAGRGRLGREWLSPAGGAWMSLAWPRRKDAAASASASLAAAAAVLRALREIAGEAAIDLKVKWPNDVLLADHKVAGILCECVGGTEAGHLIIGIGVNVDFDPAMLAGDLRHPATTLAMAMGRSVEVETVIDAVVAQLVPVLEQFDAHGLTEDVLGDVRRSLAYMGSVRQWRQPTGVITGVVAGVDDAGRLVMDCAGGRIVCEVGEFEAEGGAI